MKLYNCVEGNGESWFPLTRNLKPVMSFLGRRKTPILDAFSSLSGSVRLWGFLPPPSAGVSFVRYDLCQRALCNVCSVFSKSRDLSVPALGWGRPLKPVCFTSMKISPLSAGELEILRSLIPGFQRYKCPTCHLRIETLLLSMKCHFSLNSLTSLLR